MRGSGRDEERDGDGTEVAAPALAEIFKACGGACQPFCWKSHPTAGFYVAAGSGQAHRIQRLLCMSRGYIVLVLNWYPAYFLPEG